MNKRRINALFGVTLLLLAQCLICFRWSPQAQASLAVRAKEQLDHHALTPRLDYSFRNGSERNTSSFGDDQNRPSLPNRTLNCYLVRYSPYCIEDIVSPAGSVKRWLLYQSLLI